MLATILSVRLVSAFVSRLCILPINCFGVLMSELFSLVLCTSSWRYFDVPVLPNGEYRCLFSSKVDLNLGNF